FLHRRIHLCGAAAHRLVVRALAATATRDEMADRKPRRHVGLSAATAGLDHHPAERVGSGAGRSSSRAQPVSHCNLVAMAVLWLRAADADAGDMVACAIR